MNSKEGEIKMKNFRTYDLALDFYNEIKTLRITQREMRDQFERASLSVVLNLAEGCGRQTKKDRQRFYSISLGSLRETECLLQILCRGDLIQKSNILAAHIYKLICNPGPLA
jgi:four helix bundle protein